MNTACQYPQITVQYFFSKAQASMLIPRHRSTSGKHVRQDLQLASPQELSGCGGREYITANAVLCMFKTTALHLSTPNHVKTRLVETIEMPNRFVTFQ